MEMTSASKYFFWSSRTNFISISGQALLPLLFRISLHHHWDGSLGGFTILLERQFSFRRSDEDGLCLCMREDNECLSSEFLWVIFQSVGFDYNETLLWVHFDQCCNSCIYICTNDYVSWIFNGYIEGKRLIDSHLENLSSALIGKQYVINMDDHSSAKCILKIILNNYRINWTTNISIFRKIPPIDAKAL